MLRNERDLGFVFTDDRGVRKSNAEKCTMKNLNKGACFGSFRAVRNAYSGRADLRLRHGSDRQKLIEELIIHKPEPLELVVTGRDPAPLFTDNADYISEIKAVKHPFDKGIPARRGIEY